MVYKKKLKPIRQTLAMVLAFAMVFTSVYIGDFQVSAAEAGKDGITYDDATSTWDFTQATAGSVYAEGTDICHGLLAATPNVKTKTGFLSLTKKGEAIQIPLADSTGLVSVTIVMNGTVPGRHFLLGNSEKNVKVWHNAKAAENPSEYDADAEQPHVDSTTKAYTAELDESYFTTVNGKKYVTVTTGTDDPSGSNSGESKFSSISIVEKKIEPFEREYVFTDKSAITMEANVAVPEGTMAPDELLKFGAGFTKHDTSHGVRVGVGKITISAGDSNKITNVTVGGCNFSAETGTVQLFAGETAVSEAVSSKTTACYKPGTGTALDANNSISFDYAGDATELTLVFGGTGTNYIPYISVKGIGPEVVKAIDANITVSDGDSLLGDNDTITLKLVQDEPAADTLAAKSGDGEDTHTHDGGADTPDTEGETIVTFGKNGGSFKLKASSAYTIESSNPDIAATVGGEAKINTSIKPIDVEVVISRAAVYPEITIVDPKNILKDAKVLLTNNADEKDFVELKNGEKPRLKVGASYALSCSDAAIDVKIGGENLVKVTDDLTALTVDVAKATKHTMDVWDFGGEQLVSTEWFIYNNKLNAESINALPSYNEGKNIASFQIKDADGNVELEFNDNGKTNNRLRSVNEEITNKYDKKGLDKYTVGEGDNIKELYKYQGYIYSNSSSTDKVYMAVALKAGDILTAYVSSNGGNSDVTVEAPSGATYVHKHDTALGSSKTSELKFYAAEDGLHKMYSTNEKLVVARIMRERPAVVTVSGSVKAPEGVDLSGAQLTFTNQTTGQKTTSAITDGKYSVKLSEQYGYDISLSGVKGCIVGATNELILDNEAGDTVYDIELITVDLVAVTGSLKDLTPEDAAKLKLSLVNEEQIYVPLVTVDAKNVSYSVEVEKGVTYNVAVEDVDDYTLDTATVKMDAAGTCDIHFTKKPVYPINVTLTGVDEVDMADALKSVKLTFTNINEKDYVYNFTGTEGITLRDGQYSVKAELDFYVQKPTVDAKVSGAAADIVIPMKSDAYVPPVPYKAVITVGPEGDYQTINEALAVVRNMKRTDEQRVTISIAPGDYEEMLVIDVPNVSLVNAAGENASIELTNKGVGIAENAVRITSYYGHGYAYYSMGPDCKYDADLLAVNKANGYLSFENPGTGTTSGSYWNATVVVGASGFEADGIIFENSFNQYMSKKAAEDVIVKLGGAKEGSKHRADMEAGDTTVQDKKYVERAAALAIKDNCIEVSFDNCKFVGRQDTLYGGRNSKVAFYDCSIYGGTDFIFGGMVAVFAKCDLVMNTMEDGNDVAYITAAQQNSGRGYLMYNCNVTSTTPGVDTASAKVSKPGYFGRPWQKETSEVVFYHTIVGTASDGTSLIKPEGWNNSLGGESEKMYEYATHELTAGVDNTASRAAWSTVLTEGNFPDGKMITVAKFFGDWNPFEGKDMSIVLPDGTKLDEPKDAGDIVPDTGYYELDLAAGLIEGVKYPGGFSVMQTMSSWSAGEVTVDGVKYPGKLQGKDNPKLENGNGAKGEIPASGAVLILNAQKKGKLKIVTSTTGKTMYLVNGAGEKLWEMTPSAAGSYTFDVEEGETYYFYGNGTKVAYLAISVDYREVVRGSWADVSDPDITDVVVGELEAAEQKDAPVSGGDAADANKLTAKPGEIAVRVKGWVDEINGADAVEVDMIDAKGDVVATQSSSQKNVKENPLTDLIFKPTASGSYSFIARLVRDKEEDKTSKQTEAYAFQLPMGHAQIASITNKYKENAETGTFEIVWNKVTEAKSYQVTVTQGEKVLYDKAHTERTVLVDGLPIGETVRVAVAAIGKDSKNKSVPGLEFGDMKDAVVTKNFDRTWTLAAFGSGVNTTNNGATKNDDGTVTVYSESGKGKIVPGSTDGLAFYYTAIDPASENFSLTADIHVDKWKFSNGQEGFGMMVADAVGVHGDGTAFWNNSYQLLSTKIEYNWDPSANDGKGGITTATGDAYSKYSMKLGLGWTSKEGTTITDVAKIALGEQSTPVNFKTTSGTLETSAPMKGCPAGTYNIVGNATSPVDGTISELTDFKLQIKRDTTGYTLSYLSSTEVDESGNPVVLMKKTFYDDDRNKLTQIDKKNIYVGFVASRNARITVSNINLDTTSEYLYDPDKAEQKEITYVDPVYEVLSSDYSNSENYELVIYGNADGKMSIVDQNNDVVALDVDIAAKKKYSFGLKLQPGDNKFEIQVTPDKDYVPGENQRLNDRIKTVLVPHSVRYQEFSGDIINVAPNGTAAGLGTVESPVDIYTAVRYARAGQTIRLAGGTYSLKDPLVADRGHDGTASAYIRMEAADAAKRPVLNFSAQTENATAFTIAGDYWYLKGFDVTKSKNGQKGVQVSGDYNVLEDIDAYMNGNTGIQLSRYLGSDSYADWPSYNTILNCTSYLNADKGYEDADGFAAKLTIADGNKFVGCVAAYNADDGWDLFAKVQSGSIGAVTIENCLAFKNGYVLGKKADDGSDIINIKGVELDAGNGNGFKMGGDSMSGHHVLRNSIAFGNKAKGIDSNSCPDIEVYNCTSFDNESHNVALYTNTAVNTDYTAEGILSMKTSNRIAENIKMKGSQNRAKIYGANNYYFNGKKSVNDAGEEASLSWFVNTDMDLAIRGGITRAADGTLNMNGFLELTAAAPANVGARISGASTSAENIIVKAAEVSVYANAVTTLKDVKLPESLTGAGYEWKYPATATNVFSGTSTEFIVWQMAGEGKDKQPVEGSEKAVVVNFVEVSGVRLVGSGYGLIGDEKLTLTALPVVAPDVKLDENVQGSASFEYTFTENSKLALKTEAVEGRKDQKLVSRDASSGEGTAKFTVAMKATINGKNINKTATYSFETRKQQAYIEYTVEGAEWNNAAEAYLAAKDAAFKLTGVRAVGVEGETVKMTVSDSKVVKITNAASFEMQAVGEGTALITLTSDADKTVTRVIPVTVKSATLKTGASIVTVDKAKTAGTRMNLIACYGLKLDKASVSVKEVLKGKSTTQYASNFKITHIVGDIYALSIEDPADADKAVTVPNGTYNVNLTGKIGGVDTACETFTVKVVETKPSVSIKQNKKVNLFYKAGATSGNGALTVTSKQAKVTLTQDKTDTSAYRLSSSKTGYNVVLKAGKEANAKKDNKVKATVSFNGYKKCYDKSVTIRVGTEKKAPKLVLEVDNKVFYTQLGINETALRILDKATNTYLTGADVKLSSKPAHAKANSAFELLEENGDYTLALTGTRGGSAKISVRDADWVNENEVILSQAITVNTKAPTLTVGKATLNSNADYVGMEQAEVVLAVKNALDYKVKNVSLEGTNDKAKKVALCLDTPVVKVDDKGRNILLLSLKEKLPSDCQKGTFSFKLTYSLNNLGADKVKPATLKLTIAPAATITVKQSGSIDLVNRSGSSVTLTPVLKNLNGKVVGMSLSEDASNLFDVTWDSKKGAAVVKAKELVDMKKGGKYKVLPTFLVEINGGIVEVEMAKPITISPKQSSVKTTKLAALETRLSAPGVVAKADFKAESPAKAEILGVTQMDNFENFFVAYDAQSDTISVKLCSMNGLKAGKTYRIKVALDVQDSGVNVKPQVVTLSVKVLK